MEKPYVISEELDLSDAYSSSLIKPESLPAFRESLYDDLTNMGKNVVVLSSSEIQQFVTSQVERSSTPVVSLDDRYIRLAEGRLGISRGVDQSLNDSGYTSRGGYQSIEAQLNAIPALGTEVLLADDVVYSGEMILWVAARLQERGVKVGGVVCGVAIKEGALRLEKEGINLEAGVLFDAVEDEVCERDFTFVPGSGRRVASADANAVYFDPVYGKPSQWASLTRGSEQSFFENSLERSMSLLQADTPMQSIGKFVGYGTEGTARQQIINRLEEQS